MMERGLHAFLTGASPPIAGGRVYPRLPQNATFPAVRYQVISVRRQHAIPGGNIGPTEFSVQLDCMGNSYEDSKVLADSIRSLLHGYIGAFGNSVCRFATLETETDQQEQDGDEIRHWVSQRYLIWTNDE